MLKKSSDSLTIALKKINLISNNSNLKKLITKVLINH